MSRASRLWLAICPPALAVGGVSLALVLTSNHEKRPLLSSVLGLLVGWSFIASGVVAWSRRPENRTGRLMVAVGFTWFAGAFSDSSSSWVFTLSAAVGAIFLAVFVHLLVAYPSGRLETRAERVLVLATYVVAATANPYFLLFQARPPGCGKCPPSALLVSASRRAVEVGNLFFDSLGIAIAIAVIFILARRWRRASAVGRRALGPVLIAGGGSMILLAASFAVSNVSENASEAVSVVALASFVLVPLFFLLGLLRSRLATAGATRLLAETPHEPTQDEAQENLRRALHDPTLELVYWLPDRETYVGVDGRPYDLLPDGNGRATTTIAYDERPLGALVHDAALREEPELVGAVVAAARVALERDRLQAELRAQVEELQRERDFVSTVVNSAASLFCVVEPDGRIRRFNALFERLFLHPDDENVRGRPFSEVFVPEDEAESFRAAFDGAAAGAAHVEHEHDWCGADGRRFRIAWSATFLRDAQGEPRFLLTGVDVTERKRHEEELRRLAEEQAALRRVATLVARGPSEDELLDSVTTEVAQLFRAQAAHMWRYEGDGVRLVGGWNVPAAAPVDTYHVPARDTLVGRVMETRAPERQDGYEGVGGVIGEIVRATGIRCAIAAPIVVEGMLWGAIVASKTRDETFPGGAERRLGDFASLVAQAIGNAEARAELTSSRARIVEAADDARRKLERNLHDGAQQRLVSLSLALRLAQAQLRKDPDAAQQLLVSASAELAHALEELRELARGIHPANLSDRGLDAALEALASRAPLPVRLDPPDGRLPAQVEAAVYYVVSEALANVAKYAGASGVDVRVERRNGTALVEVADDGVGGADPAQGSGLRGLADRVAALDGRLDVESPPGAGTRITAEIPCAS
jgi:PAS domain S-box-containing protein